jgi:pimeloyl-ACP methyl ester carboxylesterase
MAAWRKSSDQVRRTRWPVLAPLAALGRALLVRIIDIYVLRQDKRLGEIILSKSLGFALVVAYTWWVGQRLSAIGLHTRNQGSALAIEAGLRGQLLASPRRARMTHEPPNQRPSSILSPGLSVMLIGLAVLVVCIAGVFGALVVLSPGTPTPFLDRAGRTLDGSISEKLHVTINGVEQGMFIRGKDKTKPVLLFLHGGPGMPEFAIADGYPIVLEDTFVVCWWEQRGSGLSFHTDIPPGTLTEDQLVSDTLAVTNYLRARFEQDKIYLMAHSGGSFFGIQAAARAPDLYRAYIGAAQISRQLDSEKLAYTYMVDRFAAAGNGAMVVRFEAIPLIGMDTMPAAYRALRDEAMHSLGIGTTHAMRSVVSGIFMPVMLSRAYTLGEKINIWRGKWSTSSTNMWNDILATDLTAKVQKLDIPVYFASGLYDYTVSYALARDYYEKLQAPMKGFYTFRQSAHSPMFEEPEKFGQILLRDVLTGATTHADMIVPVTGKSRP